MKKTIAAIAAVAALSIGIAAPAQADAADRKFIKTLVVITYYDQDYDDRETLCWGWKNFPSMAYNELAGAFAGQGFSKSDIRAGIRAGFNSVC